MSFEFYYSSNLFFGSCMSEILLRKKYFIVINFKPHISNKIMNQLIRRFLISKKCPLFFLPKVIWIFANNSGWTLIFYRRSRVWNQQWKNKRFNNSQHPRISKLFHVFVSIRSHSSMAAEKVQRMTSELSLLPFLITSPLQIISSVDLYPHFVSLPKNPGKESIFRRKFVENSSNHWKLHHVGNFFEFLLLFCITDYNFFSGMKLFRCHFMSHFTESFCCTAVYNLLPKRFNKKALYFKLHNIICQLRKF